MTKKSVLRLHKDAAAKKPTLVNIDNSPKLDPILFLETLATVADLNLGDLAYNLKLACDQMEKLRVIAMNENDEPNLTARMMAISYEAGRRYCLLAVFSVLAEEVNVLSDERIESHQGPELAM